MVYLINEEKINKICYKKYHKFFALRMYDIYNIVFLWM
jgi:hypothetical protein